MNTNFKLSIDRISITFNDHNHDQVEACRDTLIGLAKSNPAHPFRIKPSRHRQVQADIPIQESGDRVRFECGGRHRDQPDYRLDFNPSLIGSAGIDELIKILETMNIVDAAEIISSGTVTRIDLALDLEGITADDVIIRGKGFRKHGVYSNKDGIPETVYLGTPRSDRLVCYTKQAQTGSPAVLRIERRAKPRLLVSSLSGLANPFLTVRLIHCKTLLPFIDPAIAPLFFDHVRVRGVGKAISGFPISKRRAISAAIRDIDNSILPSMAEVWARWPQLLDDCGLSSLCAEQTQLASEADTTNHHLTNSNDSNVEKENT